MLGWCTLPGSLGLLFLKRWPGILDSDLSLQTEPALLSWWQRVSWACDGGEEECEKGWRVRSQG